MSSLNFSELLELLETLNTSPKKSLSQNFLIDNNIVKKIVQTANVQPGDTILEIGPGPGALTKALLDAKAHVFAIEKDHHFAKALHRLQTPDRRLTVYADDALKMSFGQIPFQKVVANLPYHITTPLLEKFFEHPFKTLTLMVQKEVATRLFAQSGSKDFGSISLFTQFHATPKSQFLVSPQCFYPKPSVDSSVIHLESRTIPNVSPTSLFKLIHTAFQKRRKMLTTSLQMCVPKEIIQKALAELSLRIDARPEMLSLNEWIAFLENIEIFTPRKT